MLKKLIILIISIIVVLTSIVGIQNSDFSKLKKYDVEGKSPREFIKKSSGSKDASSEVSVVSKNQVNLGDFVFNISGDKKLIANISILHKPKKNTDFFDTHSDEFMQKAALLRDETINAMLESRNFEMSIGNAKIKNKIKDRLNKNLKNSTVEEIYFNKFLIQ